MCPEDEAFDLDSRFLGALPVVNHSLVRLQVEALLEKRLPPPDPRSKVTPALALTVLLRSLILSKAPLYSVSEWASSMLPATLDLSAEQAAALNDDRLGQALDELSAGERVTLLTDFVLRMAREYRILLDELHNGSTSLTFQGD